jgi:hypothetical protein
MLDKNNPEGRSLLRGAYRAWYMKKNIENLEAIGIERDLAGLPVMEVPPSLLATNAALPQKQLAAALQNILTNVRRNSQEGVMLPMEYTPEGKPMYSFKLLSSGGSRQFDTNSVITRWDMRIAMSLLADFMLMGQDKVGSFALASSKVNLFTVAIGGLLDIIADVMNRFAIPRLFALNDFQVSDYPKIKHGDLGAKDLNELGQYLVRLSQAGMPLFTSPELTKYVLEVAGLPSEGVAPAPPPQIPVQSENSVGKDQKEIHNDAHAEMADALVDKDKFEDKEDK